MNRCISKKAVERPLLDDIVHKSKVCHRFGLGLECLAHCASLQILTIGSTDAKDSTIAKANALYLQANKHQH